MTDTLDKLREVLNALEHNKYYTAMTMLDSLISQQQPHVAPDNPKYPNGLAFLDDPAVVEEVANEAWAGLENVRGLPVQHYYNVAYRNIATIKRLYEEKA